MGFLKRRKKDEKAKGEKKRAKEIEEKTTTTQPETERKICQMYEEATDEYAKSSKNVNEVLWNIRRGKSADYSSYKVISMLNSDSYLSTSKWYEKWKEFLESKKLQEWVKKNIRVYGATGAPESVLKFDAVFCQLGVEEGILSGWDEPTRTESAKHDAVKMKTEPITVLRRVVANLKKIKRKK